MASAAPATIAGAFIVGLVLVLFGSIRPLLLKRLQAPEVQVDWLLAAFSATLIPVMVLAGLLIDRFGVREVFFLGSLLTSAGVFILASAKNPRQVLSAMLITGAGAASLSNSTSVLMLAAFFPGHAAASQNFGNVFFALGAITAPTIAGQLTMRLEYRRTFIFIALLCLLPAVVAVFTPRHAFDSADGQTQPSGIFSDPTLWLCAAIFIVYSPLEDSVSIWGPRYLEDLGVKPERAAWLLGCFWLSFLTGRLSAAFLFDRAAAVSVMAWSIVLLGVLAGVVMGNLAGARGRGSASLGLIAAGLVLGPIFPTLVGVLFEHFTEERGTAFGAMFAAGALGKLIVPPFIAAYSRRKSVRQTMHVPVVLAIAVALGAVVLALYPLTH